MMDKNKINLEIIRNNIGDLNDQITLLEVANNTLNSELEILGKKRDNWKQKFEEFKER